MRSGQTCSRLSSLRVAPHLWVAILGLLVCGCGRGNVRTGPIEIDADSAAAEAIKLYDAGGDGALSAEELEQSPALARAMSRIDSNADGMIDAAEIAARIQHYDSLSSHVGCEVQVIRGRRPVADATVVFEPETFLGEGFPTYTGTTNSSGAASMLTTPPTPGVAVGFYRVSIKTPDGAESVRGVEIADDADSTRITLVVD